MVARTRRIADLRKTARQIVSRASPRPQYVISDLCASLTKFPFLITYNSVRLHPLNRARHSYETMCPAYTYMLFDGFRYDVYYDQTETEMVGVWGDARRDRMGLEGADGYFDIVATEASYATLRICSDDAGEEYRRARQLIELEPAEAQSTFTLGDFTLDNPMMTFGQNGASVYTDGNLTYKRMFFSPSIRSSLLDGFPVSVMPRRQLYLCFSCVPPPFKMRFSETLCSWIPAETKEIREMLAAVVTPDPADIVVGYAKDLADPSDPDDTDLPALETSAEGR